MVKNGYKPFEYKRSAGDMDIKERKKFKIRQKSLRSYLSLCPKMLSPAIKADSVLSQFSERFFLDEKLTLLSRELDELKGNHMTTSEGTETSTPRLLLRVELSSHRQLLGVYFLPPSFSCGIS